jgi:hypothetical protein
LVSFDLLPDFQACCVPTAASSRATAEAPGAHSLARFASVGESEFKSSQEAAQGSRAMTSF